MRNSVDVYFDRKTKCVIKFANGRYKQKLFSKKSLDNNWLVSGHCSVGFSDANRKNEIKYKSINIFS